MPHWLSEFLLDVATYVPAWIVPTDDPNFLLVRGMIGLLLIILALYLIVKLRSAVVYLFSKMSRSSRPSGNTE
jgi:hypothetical protein